MRGIPKSTNKLIRGLYRSARKVGVDLETTGTEVEQILSSGEKFQNIILQMGIVVDEGGRKTAYNLPIDPYSQGVNVNREYIRKYHESEDLAFKKFGKEIPAKGTKGLYTVEAARARLEQVLAEERKSMLVIHNLPFEKKFLAERLKWQMTPQQRMRSVDTLEQARGYLRQGGKGLKSYKLEDIAQSFDFASKGLKGSMHDAVTDAYAALMVLDETKGAGLGPMLAQIHNVRTPLEIHNQRKWDKSNREYQAALKKSGLQTIHPRPLSENELEYLSTQKYIPVINREGGVLPREKISETPPIEFNLAKANMEEAFDLWQSATQNTEDAAKKYDIYAAARGEYRRAGQATFGIPKVAPETTRLSAESLAWGYTSPQQQAIWENSNTRDLIKRMGFKNKLELRDYRTNRDVEEALFMGAHSKETIEVVKRRMKYWSKISALNMDPKFLGGQLNFSPEDIKRLRGGKGYKKLRKVLNFRMSEYEIFGHLHRDVSGLAETRIASFGRFFEPGMQYWDRLETDKIMGMRKEQQPGFISTVYGRTEAFRRSDTGELLDPSQMKRVRSKVSFSAGKTTRSFRDYLVSLERRERRLGWLQDAGRLKSGYLVNKYLYNPNKGGQKQGLYDDADLERLLVEGIELEDNPYSTSNLNVDFFTGETTRAEDEATAAVKGEELTTAERTGISEGTVSKESIAADSVAFVESERKHTEFANKVRYLKDHGYSTKVIKHRGKKGFQKKVTTREKFGKKSTIVKVAGTPSWEETVHTANPWFRALFNKAKSEIAISKEKVLSRDPVVQQEQLSAISPREKLETQIGKKWVGVTRSKIESFDDLKLRQQMASESWEHAVSLGKAKIPDRALADQTFDIIFKRVKGEKGVRATRYGAYTLAGTYLGRYQGRGRPFWKGTGKVFQRSRGGKYVVGFAPIEDPFYYSAYGELEKADATRRMQKGLEPQSYDINSVGDLPKQFILENTGVSQENLKEIYLQPGGKKQLISPVVYDRGRGAFVNTETGALVAEEQWKAQYEKITKSASRHERAIYKVWLNRNTRMDKIRTIDLGIPEAGAGAGAAFGKVPRGRDMLFGALAVSAALVALTAFSGRRQVTHPKDTSREAYGAPTDDERMYNPPSQSQASARVTPEYSGPMGYTTNIDVSATDRQGIDHKNLSQVMSGHVSRTLGTNRGSVNMEINDNSDRANSYGLQRRYSNMLRS